MNPIADVSENAGVQAAIRIPRIENALLRNRYILRGRFEVVSSVQLQNLGCDHGFVE